MPLARLLHERDEDDQALQVLSGVPASFAASGLAARIELERADGDDPALREAFATLDAGEHERAVELLMERLAADASANGERDRLRRVVIGILDELGVEHPVARATRRQLATLFY